MATQYHEVDMEVRAIGARTDFAGDPVIDLAVEEDRLINNILTEGPVTPEAFAVTPGDGGTMTIRIGSNTASRTDTAVVEGSNPGQGNYIVRLGPAQVTVALDAADPSNPRIDEVYLVVLDDLYDGTGRALPVLAVRKGDAAVSPTNPGPDASWDAYALLARVEIPAAAADIEATTITDQRSVSRLNIDLKDDFVETRHMQDEAITTAKLDDLAVTTAKIADEAVTEAKIADGVLHEEVDGSTEVAGGVVLSGTAASVATVSLSIPESWKSWKCDAYATMVGAGSEPSQAANVRIRIDGVDQQEHASVVLPVGSSGTASIGVGGRRTGITTTGTRSVILRARGGGTLSDIFLYARAVRTS